MLFKGETMSGSTENVVIHQTQQLMHHEGKPKES